MELRGLNQSRAPCLTPTRSLLLSLGCLDLCVHRHRSTPTPPQLCPPPAEDPLPPPPTPPCWCPSSSTAPTSTPVPWAPQPPLPSRLGPPLPWDPLPRHLGLRPMALDITSSAVSSGHHQPPRAASSGRHWPAAYDPCQV
jgi:hypothetical protein